MPILKIPFNKSVKGLIFIDNTSWYTKECLKKAFNIKCQDGVFYTYLANGAFDKINIFGINYYKQGQMWPDVFNQMPKEKYMTAYLAPPDEFVKVELSDDFESMRLTATVSPHMYWIFGVRPGLCKCEFGRWMSWEDIYNNTDTEWLSKSEYMTQKGITSQSTLYRGIKSRKIITMDFMGRKNSLYVR